VRKACFLGAALVVLLANGWGVWQAARNRTQALGGTFRLTEHELPLQPVPFESSVTLLRLNWKVDGSGDEHRRSPAWLDASKLAELGFDCTVPPSSPQARRHYESKPARRVFLVLEHQALAIDAPGKQGPAKTELVVVDAAPRPDQLRGRYPDPEKHVICRGLIRLAFRRHDRNGTPLTNPVLEGWVEDIRPSELSVAKPMNRSLLSVRRTPSEDVNLTGGEPSYTARVNWGRNYEPWIEDVR
jgi:hypothetical protein